MTAALNPLQLLSSSIETLVASTSNRVVAIRNESNRHASGLVWQPDVVVTSEQVVGKRDEYEVATSSDRAIRAQIVGRDSGTNLLALRLRERVDVEPLAFGAVRPGALAFALAANLDGTTAARVGVVRTIGNRWFSRGGGRIDQRITLDIRLHRTEEGGPVVDASGALLGMSTLGRPGEVLVIPTATIERVVPQLLSQGRVARGWLGVALQPIQVPDALVDQAGQRIAMMVMSVVEPGPVASVGVTAGDILLSVDGIELRGMRALMAHLSEDNVGKSVELRLIRGGQVIKVETQIGTRP